MKLQVIQNGKGQDTGVYIPIEDWNIITAKYEELKALIQVNTIPTKKLSSLAGKLSTKTAEALLKHVEESRNEWED